MERDVAELVEAFQRDVAANPDLKGFDVASMVQPSVRLSTRRVPHALIGLGASRLGGIPDVPRDFVWPRWVPLKPRDNKFGARWQPLEPTPLGFIAQFDLSDLPRVDDDVPNSGWLYFFYDRYWEPWGFDPNDRGCCRVVYASCDRTELLRMPPPPDANAEHTAEMCAVEAWPEVTLPDAFADIEYGTPEFDAYRRAIEPAQSAPSCTHRLLGHPQLIQNPMELECQLASHGVYCGGASHSQQPEVASLEAGAMDWRLLLQIDTDEDGPGWMWGDVGRIYFWIKRQDLQKLRFDDVWLVFQCC
jgi:uncharacterized protein YwqG